MIDKELIQDYIKKLNSFKIQFNDIPKEYLEDIDLVKAVVSHNGYCFRAIPEKFKTNLEIIKLALHSKGEVLHSIPFDIAHSNKALALIAVNSSGQALRYCSGTLQDDEEVVSAALNNFIYSFQYASYRLKNDETFAIKAVQINGELLRYASKRLQNNKNVVLAAVKNNPNAIIYSSYRLRNDLDVALATLNTDSRCLKYLSKNIKNLTHKQENPALTIEAIINNKYLNNNIPTESNKKRIKI